MIRNVSPTLSIVIPIKVTSANRFLIHRLKNLVEFLSLYDSIEIVVVDSSEKKYIETIEKIANKSSYHYLKIDGIYSAAIARNHGAQKSKGKYLLFYDVDLIAQDNFIAGVLDDIVKLQQKAKEAFTIYPCLYLSESKTKEIEKSRIQSNMFSNMFIDIKNRYLEGYNDEVLYLAVNTSTILVNRDHFIDIGGYNEVFKGHGYEDFELIHRLYMSYKIIPIGMDYLSDYKTPFPYNYQGFRKYFAYYALPNFFEGKYTLHLWHPRPLTKKYYRHRKVNFKYFLEYLENSLKQEDNNIYLDHSLPEYQNFIDDLMHKYGYINEKYCGLHCLKYDNKHNQVLHKKTMRKIRKLFLNPKRFILDTKFLGQKVEND